MKKVISNWWAYLAVLDGLVAFIWGFLAAWAAVDHAVLLSQF